MKGVAEGIVELEASCVYGGHGHSLWGVPVPEGEGEGIISDELAEDAFMEV